MRWLSVGLGSLLLLLAASPGGVAAQPVRIGLLVPRTGDLAEEGLAARRGAELAVTQANRAGGYEGRPFELVVRSDEGAWGAGAQEIVRLVFEDGAVAIIGGIDGRTAHVAEQAITKRRLAFITPWATDPTLAQARIPWFFRTVPDADQQAEALVEEIYARRRLRDVSVVVGTSFDAKIEASAFLRESQEQGFGRPGEMYLQDGHPGAVPLAKDLALDEPDAVVLFATPDEAELLLRALEARNVKVPIFGPLALGSLSVVSISTSSEATPSSRRFEEAFREEHGEPPPAIAAHTYDAVGLVVRAVRAAGTGRSAVRDALAADDYEGATGTVRFDEDGNRATPVFIRQPEK